jgi:Glyoxalase-like domain
VSLRWIAAVVDCHDVRAQSRWWAEVLGWQIAGEDEDEDGLVSVVPPHLIDAAREVPAAERCPGLLFQPVPDGCQLANRLYLTLAPHYDGDRQAEIRRLEGLGATLIAVGEGDVDLIIMEDPEGNGFSVLSPRD